MPTSTTRTLRQQFDDDPWPVVGFLTTEHSNLTNLRSTITTEANGRAGTYLTTLSAGLVALGFVGGSADGIGPTFFRFGVVVLLIIAVVGVVTFLRCVQAAVEDLVLAQRIERVRAVYLELAPALADHFEPASSHGLDDVRRSRGMAGPWGWQLTLTLAGLVSVVNSAVVGVLVGFAVRLATASTPAPPLAGLVVFLVSWAVQMWWQSAAFRRADRSVRAQPYDPTPLG